MSIEQESDGLDDFGLNLPTETESVEEPEEAPVVEETVDDEQGQPEEELEPVEDGVEDGVEDAAEDKPDDEQHEEEQSAEPVKTIKIDGKDVPLSELTPDQITKIQTHVGQVRNYQERFEQEKAEREKAQQIVEQVQQQFTLLQLHQQAAAQQAAEQQAVQQQAPAMTPDQIVSKWKPTIDKLVENGTFSKLIAEEDPSLLAHGLEMSNELANLRNVAAQRIAAAEQRVEQLERSLQTGYETSRQNSLVSKIHDAGRSLAGEAEFFDELKDPANINKVLEAWDTLYKDNPDAEAKILQSLNNDPVGTLKRMYMGIKGDDMLAMIKATREAAEQRDKKVRRLVKGEGSAAPARKPAPERKHPDNGLEDFGMPD